MTFVGAVRSVLTQPLRFSGRVARAEFWWFTLFYAVVAALAGLVDGLIHSPVVIIVVGVVLLLPLISVSVLRLHDTGRSGWWTLVEALIPLVGAIWLLMLCAGASDEGPNQYGLPTG